jgi:hypothetical protein
MLFVYLCFKIFNKLSAATDKGEHAEQPMTDRDGQLDSVPPESIDLSDDVKSPPFGSAVVSNREWIGHATRQNFTGTVVGPRRKGNSLIFFEFMIVLVIGIQ